MLAEGFQSELDKLNKRAAGIEPAWLAWKARALPLSYARDDGWTLPVSFEDPQDLFLETAVQFAHFLNFCGTFRVVFPFLSGSHLSPSTRV